MELKEIMAEIGDKIDETLGKSGLTLSPKTKMDVITKIMRSIHQKRLKLRMIEKDMDMTTLAEKAGYSRQQLYNAINSHRGVSKSVYRAIANALDVEEQEIFGEL